MCAVISNITCSVNFPFWKPNWGLYIIMLCLSKKSINHFLLIGIHSMQGGRATTWHGFTRKRSTKRNYL